MTFSGATPHAVTARTAASAHTAAHRPNVLTAQQFIDQGTQAAAVLSISKARERSGDRPLARHLRNVAYDVAAITGEPLRAIPANDNTPQRDAA